MRGGPLVTVGVLSAGGAPVIQLAQSSGDGATGGGLGVLPLIVVMGLIFYFLIIRPQRSRARHQQELSRTLEVGDQVRTYGGLFGVVVKVDDEAVVLGLEEGRVRVAKAAIAVRMTADEDDA